MVSTSFEVRGRRRPTPAAVVLESNLIPIGHQDIECHPSLPGFALLLLDRVNHVTYLRQCLDPEYALLSVALGSSDTSCNGFPMLNFGTNGMTMMFFFFSWDFFLKDEYASLKCYQQSQLFRFKIQRFRF
jgi:hypothetical protein